jgi:hypothetical protein
MIFIQTVSVYLSIFEFFNIKSLNLQKSKQYDANIAEIRRGMKNVMSQSKLESEASFSGNNKV